MLTNNKYRPLITCCYGCGCLSSGFLLIFIIALCTINKPITEEKLMQCLEKACFGLAGGAVTAALGIFAYRGYSFFRIRNAYKRLPGDKDLKPPIEFSTT